ncbi:hypothetical protein [Campylobacter canadensis]|uniref:Uncharacterized protein n=1 Tax=Campylobacter canadensis TaxID=449520 RepID=A0ABS7WTQ0_9BACT|nr:hypothetical protein [Campylobacter canadensis]MBZ7988156.1 hypothetical protein [Campylobacter canadensis]MBZ7999155.1 hypothetical protein [Campylobacter canadensis]
MNEFLIYLAYFLDNLHDLAGGIISILIPIGYVPLFITYPMLFALTFFIGLKLYPRFIKVLYVVFFYLDFSVEISDHDSVGAILFFQIIFPFILYYPIKSIYKFIMRQNQKFIKSIFYFFSFLMISFYSVFLVNYFNLQQSPRHEVTELKKPNTLLLSTIKKQNYTIDGKFFKSVNLIVDKEVQLYEDYKKFEKSFEEEASKLPTRLSKDKLINYDIYGYFVDCSYAKSYMSFRGLKIPEHPDFDRISNSFARIFVDNYYLKLGNYDNNRGSCSNDVYKNYLNKLKGELK